MTTDTATAEAPKTDEKKEKAKVTPPKKRNRKVETFVLGWVTETAAVTDDEGNEIPGSARRCFVEMDMPPGMDESDKRSRDAIKRACKKAVYEDGLTEYGNKKLAVLKHDDFFSVDFERVTVTKLLPPEKAEKVRTENGKDCVTSTDDEPEAETEDTDEATTDDEASS